MTFLRFVFAFLLLGATVVFSQQKPDSDQFQNQFSLFPDRPSSPFPQGNTVITPSSHAELPMLRAPENFEWYVPSGRVLPMDTTCYAMRSYVVARDSKDSDSTHLVRYSTCQPASQYRLKSAEIQGSKTPQLQPR